jgi:hypothetical protein
VVAVVDAPRPRNLGPADYYLSLLYDQVADLAERPRWHARAACRGLVHLMYPAENTPAAVARAAAVCEGCPVIDECEAASTRERHGIWAAELKTQAERRRAAREAS